MIANNIESDNKDYNDILIPTIPKSYPKIFSHLFGLNENQPNLKNIPGLDDEEFLKPSLTRSNPRHYPGGTTNDNKVNLNPTLAHLDPLRIPGSVSNKIQPLDYDFTIHKRPPNKLVSLQPINNILLSHQNFIKAKLPPIESKLPAKPLKKINKKVLLICAASLIAVTLIVSVVCGVLFGIQYSNKPKVESCLDDCKFTTQSSTTITTTTLASILTSLSTPYCSILITENCVYSMFI